jgi:hypothetical protein
MVRDALKSERNYSSLSVKDLLEARNHYHWHLTHMRNVVGTAVGLYYIRSTDPWPHRKRRAQPLSQEPTEASAEPPPPKPARTFDNSEIRAYSWPCVLVMVEEWMDPPGTPNSQKVLRPEDYVPQTLYLPDGRTVPVCVIEVDPAEVDPGLPPRWTWPEKLAGGGDPLISSTQGRDNVASVGALVSDGHTTYALTSRHVAGPEGHPVSTILAGKKVEVGRSAGQQLTRLKFGEVYPEYVGHRTFVTIDAGLVEVNDIGQWRSQIHGLPPSGELADLSEHNISTRLIDAEVVAYGAASGLLRGKVAALFHRSRSRGGYDDISDFLIAPLPGSNGSHAGDSGTVWHLVMPDNEPPRPLALQWGGQRFGAGPASGFNFALATSLTTVLRLLDLELVTEHNTRAVPFWGKTGHYSIANLACLAVTKPRLATLMAANGDRVSFEVIDPKTIDETTKEAKKEHEFMPLADVPDLIWKNPPSQVQGGRDHGGNAPEHPCHHADMDEPDANGVTLRERCLANTDNVDVAVWQGHFDGLGHNAQKDRGLLPFRVWQFFDEMVAALEAKDVTRYVCAAGLLAHYVGDACQPLHGSMFADGLPDGTGAGVHHAYEADVVDRRNGLLFAGIGRAIDEDVITRPAQIRSGHGAAVATVKLMDRTAHRVDPETLVLAYADAAVAAVPQGSSRVETVTQALWEQFGEGTILTMADGVLTLAMIWQAAWNVGNGDEIPESDLVPVDTKKLQELYEEEKFVESLDLNHIAAALKT